LTLVACHAPEPATGGQLTTTNLIAFDPAKGELPEAVSFRDGSAYVSLVAAGQIAKIGPDGTRSLYAQLPVQPSNFTLGSAFDTAGNLYVAVAAGNPQDAPGVAAAGVYKIALRSGGATTATLWASAPGAGLKFANGLSFDPDGNLYVSDAAEGAIYRFTAAGAPGTATPWKTDPTLTGDTAACPGTVQAFPIGANGIFADRTSVWAVNTDRGTLVKIAVEANGSAGAAAVAATDCATLEGVDGMRPDPRGPSSGFLAANNRTNAILSISRTGQIAVVALGKPPLYSPADLTYVTGTSDPAVILVANASFAEAFAPAEAGLMPKPSLMKLSLPESP
jgi:sugar lactone lactonase YvrE